MKHKVNEVNTSIQPDHQVNNLRRVPLESRKILPDKARELWLNIRLQEKETVNGMPRMLWEKLDEDDKKEYLKKWKETSQNQSDKSHLERNINLIESLHPKFPT